MKALAVSTNLIANRARAVRPHSDKERISNIMTGNFQEAAAPFMRVPNFCEPMWPQDETGDEIRGINVVLRFSSAGRP